MSHLVLNDVAPELVEELRRRADLHGHAVDEEAKAVLAEALGMSKEAALTTVRRVRVTLETSVSSAALLRAARGR